MQTSRFTRLRKTNSFMTVLGHPQVASPQTTLHQESAERPLQPAESLESWGSLEGFTAPGSMKAAFVATMDGFCRFGFCTFFFAMGFSVSKDDKQQGDSQQAGQTDLDENHCEGHRKHQEDSQHAGIMCPSWALWCLVFDTCPGVGTR